MRAKELFESKSYTQQDIDRVVERLARGLTTPEIQTIAKNYLEKIYGTGTTSFMFYQGIMNDIMSKYQQRYGTRPIVTGKETHVPQTASKTSSRSSSVNTNTSPEELQAKKLELMRQIKKLEPVIAYSEKELAKIVKPNRSAGDWSNIDYEDKLELLNSAKKRLENYKKELAKYETQ